MTDNVAKEMTDRITVPLEKAGNAIELVEEKYRKEWLLKRKDFTVYFQLICL